MFVSKSLLILTPFFHVTSGLDRLRSSHFNSEVVGEPLTFEAPLQEPIFRRAIEEEELINGSEWLEELELESSDLHEDEMHYFDSTSFSDDEVEFVFDSPDFPLEEGTEIVDERKVAVEPIARKLRKIGTPVEISKKESLRDESLTTVRSCDRCYDRIDRQLCFHTSLIVYVYVDDSRFI